MHFFLFSSINDGFQDISIQSNSVYRVEECYLSLLKVGLIVAANVKDAYLSHHWAETVKTASVLCSGKVYFSQQWSVYAKKTSNVPLEVTDLEDCLVINI